MFCEKVYLYIFTNAIHPCPLSNIFLNIIENLVISFDKLYWCKKKPISRNDHHDENNK